jgi:hypothetical protein
VELLGDILSMELAEGMFFVGLAKVGDDWLCGNGMVDSMAWLIW